MSMEKAIPVLDSKGVEIQIGDSIRALAEIKIGTVVIDVRTVYKVQELNPKKQLVEVHYGNGKYHISSKKIIKEIP